MATTTQSESRAWDPEPDGTVASSEPAPAAPDAGDETSAADHAALEAFAAAWTRDPEAIDGPAEDSQHVPSSAAGRAPRDTRATAPASAGLPGRGVIVLSSAAAVLAVLTDFMLTGGLSMYFDLWFVVICLVGAMAVRRRDLFTAGVLAPLLFGALIGVVSLVAPSTFAARGGFGTVFPTGLTEHAAALVAGYGVALFVVACRLNAKR